MDHECLLCGQRSPCADGFPDVSDRMQICLKCGVKATFHEDGVCADCRWPERKKELERKAPKKPPEPATIDR